MSSSTEITKVDGLDLIVFDLDHTLWPLHVDQNLKPPLTQNPTGEVSDSLGFKVKTYPESDQILAKLKKAGYKLAAASRTTTPPLAVELIKFFRWEKYFDYLEIHPGSKLTHFKKLKDDSGVPYNKILFFDDEIRNITDLEAIGVVCYHVADGMSHNTVASGLEKFLLKKGK